MGSYKELATHRIPLTDDLETKKALILDKMLCIAPKINAGTFESYAATSWATR